MANRKVVDFKAHFFPLTTLELEDIALEKVLQEIRSTCLSAPHYFNEAPIVLDLTKIPESSINKKNLLALIQQLRENNMIPVGVCGTTHWKERDFLPAGLCALKKPSVRQKNSEQPMKKTQVVTSPIRSGMQIYAREADLIIMAAVNAGGECFADGNIHIYGPLRGKALAGASGDCSAKIFCQALEAELVAIAGYYLRKEKIVMENGEKSMLHLFLENEKICIETV